MNNQLTRGIALGPERASGNQRTNSSVLQTNRLLRTLSPEQLADFIGGGYWEHFVAGEEICSRGTIVDRVLFIVEGHAQSQAAPVHDGSFDHLMNFFSPGDAIGLLSLIDDAPHFVAVEAVEDVRALAFPAESLRSFLKLHPEWYQALAEMAVSQLRAGGLFSQTMS